MKLFKKSQSIENDVLSASKKHLKGTVSEHGHDFFEIEYIINGSGTYVIDGISYIMRPGMLFLMSPSNFHSVKNCNAEIFNVMFSCNICEAKTLYNLYNVSPPAAIHCSENDSILIEKLFCEIITSNSEYYSIQFLKCILYKISSLMPELKNAAGTYIQSAIIYIQENFRSKISLTSAARYVGITPEYLSSLFHHETGISFKEYLDNLRFDYVSKQLVFTDMSVSEICREAGFYDYTNFTRRFKSRYKCTPSVYRKKLKKP